MNSRKLEQACPPAEIIDPLIEAVGDFMDAEESMWWVGTLKVLIYAGVFALVPLYFYFT